MPRAFRLDSRCIAFECPGCECCHQVPIEGAGAWQWNGRLDRPTLYPSIKISNGERTLCHTWVRDGRIQFLSDCAHALAGKTVDIPEIEP